MNINEDYGSYKELATVHHKLAEVYAYLDKVLEFNSHYQKELDTTKYELSKLQHSAENTNKQLLIKCNQVEYLQAQLAELQSKLENKEV